MTTALDVSWARVEKAVENLKEYYCEWRPKAAAGQATGTLGGVYRGVVVEVTEEAHSRAAFNFNEFPYERPRAGELPGFFALRATPEREELRKSLHAIYREFGLLNGYGYYGEMSAIASDMALELGTKGLPVVAAGASADVRAAADDRAEAKRERLAVLLGLARVLQHVSLDCMRMRGDFVRMISVDGLAVASWTMNDLVAAGEVGGSQSFGVVSRKVKGKTLEERMKVRAKMEAHRMEGGAGAAGSGVAASRESPSDGPSARRN